MQGACSTTATLVGLAIFTLAGCARPLPYQPVTGRITLDGQPLPGADIVFLPVGEQGEPSFGSTDAQGTYELRHTQSLTGAPTGEYSVRISTFREAKESDDEAAPPISPERVPQRYNLNSELTAKIVDGENKIDFELKSGG